MTLRGSYVGEMVLTLVVGFDLAFYLGAFCDSAHLEIEGV